MLGTFQKMWPSWRAPILFAIVGLANTATYIVAVLILTYVAHVPSVAASAASYVLAVVVAFLGNAVFVFDSGRWNSPRQMLAYAILYGTGLIWNMNCVNLLTVLTGSPVYGFIVFSITWPPLSFIISKTIVFRVSKRDGN